jgi:hypothetical protein
MSLSQYYERDAMTEEEYEYTQAGNLQKKTTEELIKEGWPKDIVVVRTYSKSYLDPDEVVAEIRENLADGYSIVLPGDEYRTKLHYTDNGEEYDEDHEKAEFLSVYPDMEWPPHTIEHLMQIHKKDIADEAITVDDVFDEDESSDEWEIR